MLSFIITLIAINVVFGLNSYIISYLDYYKPQTLGNDALDIDGC